ncbi:MAG TPA: TM2 domain-containing protein [Kiritimatiellia bacterium]|nr:TM2 domain-containing protein [Kiritimatiellia bacterium]HMP35239.1 TM2 domain-containing protein [Kiritimatiellia bacterium]
MTESASKGIDEKYCTECGAIIKAKAEICPKCGVRQIAKSAAINLGPTTANGKSRIAAALLAFFLGGIGVHKFYLGQPGLGIVYLLFCWTFIPAIIAFIEFIIYLTMSDEAFNQKYGQA